MAVAARRAEVGFARSTGALLNALRPQLLLLSEPSSETNTETELAELSKLSCPSEAVL